MVGHSNRSSVSEFGQYMSMANSCSRRSRSLIEPATVLTPTIGFEIRTSGVRCFNRSFSLQPRVSSVPVVIVSERD
jgi:hypothetical protein